LISLMLFSFDRVSAVLAMRVTVFLRKRGGAQLKPVSLCRFVVIHSGPPGSRFILRTKERYRRNCRRSGLQMRRFRINGSVVLLSDNFLIFKDSMLARFHSTERLPD